MEEFIIWDNKYKLFLDENFKDTLQDNGIDYEEDDLYCGDEYYPLCIMDFIMGSDCEPYKDRLSKLFYIGLNDINNNKIYDDSSIIEFYNKYTNNIQKGYFKYNKKELCYEIHTFTGGILNYCKNINHISDIKIIDTIQENKLGLIKE